MPNTTAVRKKHANLLSSCLSCSLMESSASIACALSGLDPNNLMGGDWKALAEVIANYFDDEREEPHKINHSSSKLSNTVLITQATQKYYVYYTLLYTVTVCAQMKILALTDWRETIPP